MKFLGKLMLGMGLKTGIDDTGALRMALQKFANLHSSLRLTLDTEIATTLRSNNWICPYRSSRVLTVCI